MVTFKRPTNYHAKYWALRVYSANLCNFHLCNFHRPLTLSRRNSHTAPQENLTNTQNLFSTHRHHHSFLSLRRTEPQGLDLLMSSSFSLSLFNSLLSERNLEDHEKDLSRTFNEDFRGTKEISELQRSIYQSLKHLQIARRLNSYFNVFFLSEPQHKNRNSAFHILLFEMSWKRKS